MGGRGRDGLQEPLLRNFPGEDYKVKKSKLACFYAESTGSSGGG
jgi:hypothetical protein